MTKSKVQTDQLGLFSQEPPKLSPMRSADPGVAAAEDAQVAEWMIALESLEQPELETKYVSRERELDLLIALCARFCLPCWVQDHKHGYTVTYRATPTFVERALEPTYEFLLAALEDHLRAATAEFIEEAVSGRIRYVGRGPFGVRGKRESRG
jgi:hypothetical protein